jgi:DUF2934 family protein
VIQENRSMKDRARKPVRAPRRPAAPTSGNGGISEPRRDPDVAQLACADAEARTADHRVQVALVAYFIAEKRGFEPGHELDDWLAAETQIAAAEQPSFTQPVQPVKAENIA